VDKEFAIVVALIVLAFLFVLPSWVQVEPSLKVTNAQLQGERVQFSIDYSAPEPKSCYIVVYGPFQYDQIGHETGNNIFVLTNRKGTLSDTLTLQENASLSELRAELWCDNDLKANAISPIAP